VVMNLVQNAVDAASGAPQGNPVLAIAAEVVDGQAVLRVRDNGPGVASENLSRIFDPFFTTKPVGKGTGLGLSISYGIVEQHGGQLSVRNHPEGGAEFTVALPALG
jgi:two-component system sensor histidine kinase HupT/HoxJ